MGAKAAGSIFWAVFLVLFPVSVQISSPRCVTYKHRQTCGLKGSSVELPCSYPNNRQGILISGWSRKLHPNRKLTPLKEMPAYSRRMNYLELGDFDCTLKLRRLKYTDASIYYFVYNFRNVTGYRVTCEGAPGVKLNIFASPVKIQVGKLVRGQYVPVADLTVIEGQRITLTCVSTCAANLNSNPGYIWYKNGLQLNGNRANSSFLSLDPISDEDTGSYVCAMIGHKDLPSSAVTLTVQGRPSYSVVSDIRNGGSKEDSVLYKKHGCDAQNSTHQLFNNCQTPKSKSMLTFLTIILVAGVCIGWVTVIMVTIVVLRVKKRKKRRSRCVGSVPGPPNPNTDCYMALDIKSMSADYDTLDTVRHCSAADPDYENLDQTPQDKREVLQQPTTSVA